ncbi:MAG: amidohydrolase family protein [Lachnospiraceae bacterium]|nr:amidohydrolase family protein [Lachnospiraceae bacterium]
MAKLIVTDAAVLCADGKIRKHQTLEAVDGIITAIRPYDSSDVGSCMHDSFIDGYGKLVMPGLADCHMHTGQQLLKGRILDELPMIWTRIMLPFESTLTPELMRLSAELAALEMIHSGTTAFVDAGSYHMQEAAAVYAQSGLRGVLSVSTMDAPGLPASIACDAGKAVSMTEALADACAGYPLIKTAWSLRSLMSCSEELIIMVSQRAREHGALLQAHMNEYAGEVNDILQHRSMRPFEYLDSLGVLGPHFIAAHCLMLSEQEKNLIQKHDVKITHCPFSNCGKGIPDTPALLNRGICVGLGTDGAAHGGLSLWNEMKIFRSVMNAAHGVPSGDPAIMPAARILQMSTENGYRLIGEPDGGSLAVGKKADFITIDLRHPHLMPTGNLIHTLLECVTAGDVCDMAANGKLLMKSREILTLDEERILHDAENYLERLNLL